MKALIFAPAVQSAARSFTTAPADVELVPLGREDCDVADRDALAAAIEATSPDLVINAAAYTAVDRAESEPEAAGLINGSVPGWMATGAKAAGARFVHISTDFVFGTSSGTPLRPDDATDPQSIYGSTKLEGEQAVASADHAALIIRTAWVYAAQGQNFVLTMLRLMRERDRLSVVGDQVGTPTYAPSLAQAIWSLDAAGESGLHHFTDAGVASWYDFAVAIQEEALALGMLQRPVEVVPIATADYPVPARRPAYSLLDKSATWSALGGAAPHWRVNLRACLEEIRRNG
jgi:dTDP-4-dehydrorhamnose reductase